MRILHIGKYFPPATGGMERFLGDLAKAQRADGHEVAVLVHADKAAPYADDPPWVLRCPVWLRLLFAPISPAFPAWLSRAIRGFQPDVIHIHMPNPSAFWAMLLPAARRIPWVVHWHSDVELSRHGVRAAYSLYHLFERALLERAEAIIVTSPQYLEASRPLHPWRHICHVVPLGVDPSRLPAVDPSEAAGLWRTEGLRLLAVGRLTYYKGFETLVRAVVNEPGHELVIVGEGEERARLECILKDAGDPSWIRLVGEADDRTLNCLLASCDVFCLPSCERTEAFGIVLMEAMRHGKPLLVSDLRGSGVTWVARDGQNAVTVPPEDVSAWSAALRALGESPSRRQMLGHLGYQRYEREFDIAGVARRIGTVHALALRTRLGDLAEPQLNDASYVEEEPERKSATPIAYADRLLVVIPALNEANDIGDVIRQVRAQGVADVLVVDDGSIDDTASIALVNGAAVIRAPLWQGAWGAIQTGIRYAVRRGYAGVVTMDADGQHEPGYLPQLLEAADRGADVVIASCPGRGSAARHVAWWYFRLLTGFELDDLTSGFRYYNTKACSLLAAEEATLLDYQDIGVLLLLQRARLRIAEISVEMNPRRHGASRVFSSWWTVGLYMAETSVLCLARWNKTPKKRVAVPE